MYPRCQVSCITEWNLKRHVKRTHCNAFTCKECGKEFKKNKLLQQHISTHHKQSMSCEFPGCAQIFKSGNHHELQYVCEECHWKLLLLLYSGIVYFIYQTMLIMVSLNSKSGHEKWSKYFGTNMCFSVYFGTSDITI